MGFFELLLIALVVLLFFGAGKLPAIGAGLGRTVRAAKDAFREEAPKPSAQEPPREALPPARAPPANDPPA